ncbi:MAG: hypothetical protein RLZZ210_462 [Pseudomonadota bacterium]
MSSAPIRKVYEYKVVSASKCEYEPRIVCDICLSKRGKMSEYAKSSDNDSKSVYPVLNDKGQIIDGIHGMSEKFEKEELEKAFVSEYGYQYAVVRNGELSPY